MGTLMGNICLVAALGLLLCSAAPVSDSLVVFVRSPVSVLRGHTTTLPCWLNSQQNAEGLEVRWYRPDHFDSPVLLYRAKTFENASQEASYIGRVSFGLKDAASGGLKVGDVSLKLENVALQDAGDYMCYVSSDQGYDSASVRLDVTKKGTSPLLSSAWKEADMVNVSCESGGWFPEPDLRWADQKRALTSKNTKYSTDSSGLLWVHSWLLVPASTEVSCSVGLPGEEAMEARIRLGNAPQSGSGSSVPGWVAFALLLITVLSVLGVLYYKKKRVKKTKQGSDTREENEELLSIVTGGVIQSTEYSTACNNYVNVTLDKVDNPFLISRNDCILRDADRQDFPDGTNVTCLTAVKGKPGFSSGKHYWEVSLGNDKIGLKQSWWVGVTSEDSFSKDTSPTSSNGFWFLSSSRDRAESFQFSTEPNVLVPVYSRPHTVGVYLDYECGELSFYNVGDKSLIGSLTANFKGEVFPFFNPGKSDSAPMKIEHKEKNDEFSGTQELQPLSNDISKN